MRAKTIIMAPTLMAHFIVFVAGLMVVSANESSAADERTIEAITARRTVANTTFRTLLPFIANTSDQDIRQIVPSHGLEPVASRIGDDPVSGCAHVEQFRIRNRSVFLPVVEAPVQSYQYN